MQIPFFYETQLRDDPTLILNEDSSRHIVQVLRMKEGEFIHLTNGKGLLTKAQITSAHKKHTAVNIIERKNFAAPEVKISIAISLVKNTGRFEWFLEKATEIGVSEIIPLLCKRTEKSHLRTERMQSILVSAMLQSQQTWMPHLHDATTFEKLIEKNWGSEKYIAHCLENEKKELRDMSFQTDSRIILIGPEGDFTEEEIQKALSHHFTPVSLGNTRLRTETAGMVASVLLQ